MRDRERSDRDDFLARAVAAGRGPEEPGQRWGWFAMWLREYQAAGGSAERFADLRNPHDAEDPGSGGF